MATPGLTDEFNGASKLLQGLFMWLLGVDANGNSVDNDQAGDGFMAMLRKLLNPNATDSNAGATPPVTQESPQTSPGGTAPAATVPAPPKVDPGATPKTAHNILTYGDSLALGYGSALSKEFGAANVTNQGVGGAGFLGGTPLAELDKSKINKDTVAVISIGTNDVGFRSYKDQKKINDYADMVVKIADEDVKKAGGTPVMIAMRAPDKPLEIRDPATKQMRPQTAEEFDAWKKTMNAMNDAIAKLAAEKGIAFVTPEGGTYAADGIHQTGAGYRATADNALKAAGVTVTNS